MSDTTLQMPDNSQAVAAGDYLAWVHEFDDSGNTIGGHVVYPQQIFIGDDGTQYIQYDDNYGNPSVLQTTTETPTFELYQRVRNGA